MRKILLALFALATLNSGCRQSSGIRNYWSERSVDIEDIHAAEEQFTDFAELAVAAPEADACVAIDRLLKKAGRDEVTFLVYSDWIARAFGLIASPCYSVPLFVHSANAVLSKQKPGSYLAEEYRAKLEFCLHNQAGSKAELPIQYDFAERSLFLVVNQGCPSCRKAMDRLASEFSGKAHLVALCHGRGPLPESQGWECVRLPDDQRIFDTAQSPFYFVTSADGTVELPYKSAFSYEN